MVCWIRTHRKLFHFSNLCMPLVDVNRRSEKAGSRQESNPGHLWLQPPVLCYSAMTARQPSTLTILYTCCTGGTECLSCTPGSHSVCAVRTLLEVDLLHQDCEGWWLSGCRGSVAELWRLKPEVSWIRLPVTAGLFTLFSPLNSLYG